ncbi:MAG: hypothetical protein INR70_09660 [Parafilimonas terrae]|nr:hypothetical protein [Parafilimonas terrae]
MNLSDSIGVTIFGGLAPSRIESLIALTHTPHAASVFLTFAAGVSFACPIHVRRRMSRRA